jgi:hypothetical protein
MKLTLFWTNQKLQTNFFLYIENFHKKFVCSKQFCHFFSKIILKIIKIYCFFLHAGKNTYLHRIFVIPLIVHFKNTVMQKKFGFLRIVTLSVLCNNGIDYKNALHGRHCIPRKRKCEFCSFF